MIEWNFVKDWLMKTGYINENWSKIQVSTYGIYCSDVVENTSISVFVNGGFLVCFVGCLEPKIYVGGDTDCECEHHCDVINYLSDELDGWFEKLELKMGYKGW